MATRKKKASNAGLNEKLETANLVGKTMVTWKAVLVAFGVLGSVGVAYHLTHKIDVQNENPNRIDVRHENQNRIPVH